MKKKIKSLLKSIELLPLNKRNWCIFRLKHIKPTNKVCEKGMRLFIKQQVGNADGIYIYKNIKGEILYIGKAKPLRSRLYSHYLESFKKPSCNANDRRWHRFFASNRGELTVYWRKIDYERDRKVIEQMLEHVFSPKFLIK